MYKIKQDRLIFGLMLAFWMLLVSLLLADIANAQDDFPCDEFSDLGGDGKCYRILNDFFQFDPEEEYVCAFFEAPNADDEEGNPMVWYETVTLYSIEVYYYLLDYPGSYRGVCEGDIPDNQDPEDWEDEPEPQFMTLAEAIHGKVCRVEMYEGIQSLVCN